MNLCDTRTVKNIMEAFGLRFRKEFGQNFLTDRSVVEEIAEQCTDTADGTILEIGPGIGTLTRELAARHREVVALEIDRTLIPALAYTLSDFKNVRVIEEDAMKTDLAALLAPYFEKGAVSVCANLPYYITTPILMKLLESRLPFRHITVMVQSEVADRLCAPAGGKEYGAITAVLGYYGEATRLFKVSAAKFLPPPKVIPPWCRSGCMKKNRIIRRMRRSFSARSKRRLNSGAKRCPMHSRRAFRNLLRRIAPTW